MHIQPLWILKKEVRMIAMVPNNRELHNTEQDIINDMQLLKISLKQCFEDNLITRIFNSIIYS